MEKEIRRFIAETDDGEKFTIIEYQNFTTHRPINGPSQTIPGLKRLTLLDGSHVNMIDEETFQIVQTDQIIRKI